MFPHDRTPFGRQQRSSKCRASKDQRIEAARAIQRPDSDENSRNRETHMNQAERKRNSIVRAGDRVAKAPVSPQQLPRLDYVDAPIEEVSPQEFGLYEIPF